MFMNYFCCNGSFPALLGEMISKSLNIVEFSWISCPAATELEQATPPGISARLASTPEP
jgi:Pyridoxal-dependent decarboxylase conserved domain